MTKRFSIEQTTINECIVDNTTGEQLDTVDYTERLCEVLNELHEENEKLRYDYNEKCNEYMGLEEQIDTLLKENEQLKQELYQQEVSEQRRKEYDEFWKEKINKEVVK